MKLYRFTIGIKDTKVEGKNVSMARAKAVEPAVLCGETIQLICILKTVVEPADNTVIKIFGLR